MHCMKLLYNDSEYSEKTKYRVMSRVQNVGENNYIRVANKSFENVQQFNIWEQINKNSTHENIRKKMKSGKACY